MNIYTIPFCPFCFRVKLTTQIKNISLSEVSFLEIDLKNPPEKFVQLNPNKTVPTVEISSTQGLAESLVIMEYLDETFAAKTLLFGKDSTEKALNKYLIERLNNEVTGYLMACFFSCQSKVKFTQALEKLHLAYENLEKLLPKNSVFFGGNQLNAVDISFAPFFCYFYLTQLFRNEIFLPGKETKSFHYFNALRSDENIKKIILDNNFFKNHIEDCIKDKEEIQKIKKSSRALISNLPEAVAQLNNKLQNTFYKNITWHLKSNTSGPYILTNFKFSNYHQALNALEYLCDLQETSDHHTNFRLDNFTELAVEICTHQPKWGVTEMDLAFAEVLSTHIFN
ncbi:glutathione S-transferase N-terminal domain-containing protein [Pigmentibacter sp. JX0631]|uniref:glutathione S-transferase N-terminal domain-containing protein n=1 Tax=Pigmentibacter sp. JX0631 TaxID=2976982 RepID=UPI002468C993|nr:glutathione S-transferase N-terminal domain-containing protein [Pigmentibacter sp. JX0631]WGL59016.1 glutathione S-transferase N-terminal domain-containing protein [Pigmentibacter sp. JX0631]